MRLPEKPPFWKDILKQDKARVGNILGNIKLFNNVKEFNKKYLYWSELKYRIKNSKDRKAIWTIMKFMRNENEEISSFKQIKLKYNLLSEFNKKLHYFDKQLAGNISSQTATIGLEEKYIISSLMEESIASSIVEGASTTRRVAKEMLRAKRKPKDKSEKMIFNNYETMKIVSKKRQEKLTPKFLLNIQKTITIGTLDNKTDEGIFRDNNDIVVGDGIEADKIAYIPPDYKKIPSLIKELCKFANNDTEDFVHPVIKGIMIHFLIGYIHPFNDGNGRTARSVFYWYMLSKGYWLFEYMSVSRRIVRSRKEYDLAYLYTEYDELDLTYFIKYNIECIDESLKDLFKYIKKKQQEQKETRELIDEKLGLNLRQMDILKNFRQESDKIFTIKEIQISYDITYETARTDLMLLVEKKLVKKQIAGKAFVFLLNKK